MRGRLVGRQHLGEHLVDAHVAGHGLGAAAVVAAEQQGAQAHRVQRGDGRRGRRA